MPTTIQPIATTRSGSKIRIMVPLKSTISKASPMRLLENVGLDKIKGEFSGSVGDTHIAIA